MNNIVIKRQLVQMTNATIFGCASQEKRYKGERISILGGYCFVYFQKRNKGPAVWAFFQCQVLISFRLLSWCCWQAVPKATKKLGFIHSNCARLGFMCWDEKSVEVRSSRESITSSLTTIIDPAHCADFSTTDGDITDDMYHCSLREELQQYFKSRVCTSVWSVNLNVLKRLSVHHYWSLNGRKRDTLTLPDASGKIIHY